MLFRFEDAQPPMRMCFRSLMPTPPHSFPMIRSQPASARPRRVALALGFDYGARNINGMRVTAASAMKQAETRLSPLGPLRLLLVIREWLGLRDLVQDAGTLPLCRAAV
jgi:hypothetical protein